MKTIARATSLAIRKRANRQALHRLLLAISLAGLTAGSAVAVESSSQEFSVSAKVPTPRFTVWPTLTGDYQLSYDKQTDTFQAFARPLEIQSNLGGMQVRQAHAPQFVDESGTVTTALEMFVGVSGGSAGSEELLGTGEPVELMPRSGSREITLALGAQKANAHGDRLRSGVYTASLSLIFEVIQP